MNKLGLSGDSVIIDRNVVIKTCETNQDRFIKNINKQKLFINEYINSVCILNDGLNKENKNYIIMPLLKCDNCIIWLSKTSKDDVDKLVDIIINYFTSLLNNSEIKQFEYKEWIDKIEELNNKISDNDLLLILDSLKNIQFSNKFYYGNYHGDFTLSNLFIYNDYKNNNIFVDAIDFLESFIYSPINDLVKIRQDTNHLWTLRLLSDIENVDFNKIIITLNYIDNKIKEFIINNKIINEFYLPFQILNLIRIIPYNKEKKVFEYLKKEIQELFNEFNSNNALRRKINKI